MSGGGPATGGPSRRWHTIAAAKSAVPARSGPLTEFQPRCQNSGGRRPMCRSAGRLPLTTAQRAPALFSQMVPGHLHKFRRNSCVHHCVDPQSNMEGLMRKLVIGLLTATGLAATGLAATGVALSVPASAQGVFVGAGPVGVGVGVGPGWGYRDGYYGSGYRSGYRSYAYDDGYRRHCRLVRDRFNGHVRTVRRCW
jgi:hypothetical protein